MKLELAAFIANARRIAASRGMKWDFECSPDGDVAKAERWNLTSLRGSFEKPITYFTPLSVFEPALVPLKELGHDALAHPDKLRLTEPWRELFKAIVVHDQFVRGNKPRNATNNLGHAFRILATCAPHRSPDELTADDIKLAFNVALATGASGKRGGLLRALIVHWFDGHQLTFNGPLSSYCVPFADAVFVEQHQKLAAMSRSQTDTKRPKALRTELRQKKDAERLPATDAFWEFVRIIFTERPRTLSDAIRFAQHRIALVTGLRVGQMATLPADTIHTFEHLDHRGEAPSKSGGVDSSIGVRHFAEKDPNDEGETGVIGIEQMQHVPAIFRTIIEESVAEVLSLTAPMRARLTEQARTGRLFPEFDPDDLIPWTEMYVRMSGNAQFSAAPLQPDLLEEYKRTHNPSILMKLREDQALQCRRKGPNRHVRAYFKRLSEKSGMQLVRTPMGYTVEPRHGERHYFIKVADAELYARHHLTSKISDLTSVDLDGGVSLPPEGFLFLYPGRAKIEAEHEGVVDTELYFSVRRTGINDAIKHLGVDLFERYSEGDAKAFSINPHSLRHLQNTELFKAGLADAVITKRFGRTEVQQSYVYDHRTLREHLDVVDVPETPVDRLGPHAQEAHRLIARGKINGPVVREFLELQRTDGDDVALDYLNAEVTALHATPYGFCLNSFAVNPCVKHLECFNSCGHLVRTDNPAEEAQLHLIRNRLERSVVAWNNAPPAGPKATHHLVHIETRLAGVKAALAQTPGKQVFPNGEDRFTPLPAE